MEAIKIDIRLIAAINHDLLAPDRLEAGSRHRAHASVAILEDEAALSQRLRTPPLPVTHALVGD